MVVPYSGFQSDLLWAIFHLIPGKKYRFLPLMQKILGAKKWSLWRYSKVWWGSVRPLPWLSQMQSFIPRRWTKPSAEVSVLLCTCWLVGHWGKICTAYIPGKMGWSSALDEWAAFQNWHCFRRVKYWLHYVSIAPLLLRDVYDYWSEKEWTCDASKKEAVAVDRVLRASQDNLWITWVDVRVDHEALIHS